MKLERGVLSDERDLNNEALHSERNHVAETEVGDKKVAECSQRVAAAYLVGGK